MRVLITGGTGAVGMAVIELCVAQGWETRVIGRRPNMETPGAEYVVCDVLDYAGLREQIRGCDTVIHLAAIPNPRIAPGPEVFHTNTLGTYHVYEAAAEEGISKLVQASSINAFGCFWGNQDITPSYLPIDEAHTTFTTDPYSFSKEVIEDMGDYFWRREGISSVALRLPGVWNRERLTSEEMRARQGQMRTAIDAFANLTDDERAARLAQVRESCLAFRRQRMFEYPAALDTIPTQEFSDDALWMQYNFDRLNFWTYVDERDSAQACVKGVTADYEGSHALFINAANNWLNYESKALAHLFFPEVTVWKGAANGIESLVSIDRARALIGFEPEYST